MYYEGFIKPFEPHFIDLLVDDMCQVDIDEVYAAHGVNPRDAVRSSVLSSDRLVCYFDDDILLGIGGVGTTINGDGIPWLLSTNYLQTWKRKNLRSFLKSTRSWIEHMNEIYPYMHNYVDSRNKESIVWLEHLGFNLTETIQNYGHSKIPFIKFIKYSD